MARVYVERRDLPAHLLQLLDESRSAAECTPPMDVLETATGLDVCLDVPGVAAAEIDILFTDGVLLLAGQKRPARCEHGDARFHVAERAFGRFARALRVEGAFDVSRAAATLTNGQLRVVLPRIEERRGAHLRIAIR